MVNFDSRYKKLDDLGFVGRGKSKHRPRNDPKLYGGPYPFIQTGDVKHSSFYVTEYSQTYNEVGLAQSKLWQPGTLCITIAANIAETAILSFPACFPDSIIGFIADTSKADLKFVKYCLETYKPQMQSISQGTTQDNMSLEKLLSFNLYVPKLETQKKIAAVLSAYDDLIENNKRRIAMLEKMAEEIYREWFVRLRFPGHETTKLEKGVPTDWKSGRFRDLCTLQRGFDLPDSQITFGEFPVVASTSIKAYHSAYKVEPPVITTGRSGSLGTVIWVNKKAWPLNTSLYVKNFHGNSPFYVFHTLRGMNLANFNSGAGVPSLNRNHLNNLAMSIPPSRIQDEFAKHVSPMQELKDNLELGTKKQIQTRNLLLPRLISGKLSVEDLNIQFPPSMIEEEQSEPEAAYA